MSQSPTYVNPQTGLVLELPAPPHIFTLQADCRLGEQDFRVHTIGSGMWVTTEDHDRGVPAGAILVRDRSQDATGKSPHVMILEGGLHSAIRQQADHLPASLTEQIDDITLSAEMALDACMDARALHLASPAQVQMWSQVVRHIVERMPKARSELMLEAKGFLQFAVDPFDSLDRLNGPSRMLILKAAIRRLQAQVRVSSYLRDITIPRRVLELFAAYDKIWRIRTETLQETWSAAVMFNRPETITGDWLERASARMVICASALESVYVAPYGTNSFRRCARDIRDGVRAMREERFGEAVERFGIARRSLELLGLQRELEAHLRTISHANRQMVVPPAKQQGAFARTLDERREFLETHPDFDAGFENRIAGDLAKYLESAVDAAVGQSWNGQGVYSALSDACACFGRNRKAA